VGGPAGWRARPERPGASVEGWGDTRGLVQRVDMYSAKLPTLMGAPKTTSFFMTGHWMRAGTSHSRRSAAKVMAAATKAPREMLANTMAMPPWPGAMPTATRVNRSSPRARVMATVRKRSERARSFSGTYWKRCRNSPRPMPGM